MNSLDPKNHTDKSLRLIVTEGEEGAWWTKKTRRLSKDKRRELWAQFTAAYAAVAPGDATAKKAKRTASRKTQKAKAKKKG